ncbi:cache domain-containing protein [Candidatus Magnetominusculus xianensis]|uniref:histidine kinase n=1 Tax=Candidatus Magnetominusculus xianensis TaxID=1748249 RepID=A0ABR5SDN4_9BACT|nr:cache domain-containing protein [Candidatus Magnetominusculus xianensis]KWT81176.1 multi-sensor hybrid histidine kinase [Candidatus Magnetominusculus xianensis]MBF0404310.1 cache domain-containing protein [Nitrospirota bacterium]
MINKKGRDFVDFFRKKLLKEYTVTLSINRYSIIFGIIIMIAIHVTSIYLFSQSVVKKEVFEIKKSSVKTVLRNVYEIVHLIDKNFQSYKDSAIQTKVSEVKSVVMLAESYINIMEGQANGLSQVTIEKKILETISSFNYGNKDYIFIFDNNSEILASPDPKLMDYDCSYDDYTGKHIMPNMVESALRDGEGYQIYKWKRRNTDNKSVEKLTYYKYLPKQKWIVVTGVCIDDIEKAVNSIMTDATNRLRQTLRDSNVENLVNIFIFTSRNVKPAASLLVHPEKTMELTNMELYIDPVTKKSLYEELTAVADNPDGLRYKWDSPKDPGHYVHDKIMWVLFYKPFGWYICASVYVNEPQNIINSLVERILTNTWTVLLLITGFLFFLRMILSDVFLHFETLQTANDKLKILNGKKTEFISNVSHEIRTPLTSVLGFAEMIKESFEETVLPHVNMADKKVERSVDRIKDNIDTIISEGRRLTSLTTDVLDIVKMEAGKMVWKEDIVNMKHLLNYATKMTVLPEQRKDALKVICESIPDTICDFNRILQVILNLISNALKFSTDGDIILKADYNDNEKHLTISVADQGMGIPIEKQKKVFEKFEQLGDTLTDKPTGTGLGLSICKEIIEHHRGRIWVETTQGKGSTFSFTLPVKQTNQDLI